MIIDPPLIALQLDLASSTSSIAGCFLTQLPLLLLLLLSFFFLSSFFLSFSLSSLE